MYQLKYYNLKYYNNEEIAALLPVYTEGVGDTTQIIDIGGKRKMLYAKIDSVINRLLILFSFDVGTLREKYEGIILQKKKLPLPLSQDLILLPFKVRRPLVKGDPAYGYINYTCIKHCDSAGKHSKLLLKNGIEIPLIQSLVTTQKNLMQAKLIANEMELQKHRNAIGSREEILAKKLNPASTDDKFTLFEQIISEINKDESNK